MARRLPKTKEVSDQETAVRVAVSVIEETPVYYVNFAEVSNTPNDVSVTCTRIPSKLTRLMSDELKNSGTITLTSNVQLVFPVGMLFGLIKALQTQEKLLNETMKARGVKDE